MTEKRVFVTVGTTEFNDLVKTVVNKNVLEALVSKGYTKIIIQKGKGEFIPDEGIQNGIQVEVFRYKDSLYSDFLKADLIISHAGAGSCFEALEMSKPLIAVVNHSLMNNHQTELAEALAEEGFCSWCYPETLWSTIEEFDYNKLNKYEPGNPKKLVEYIESVFQIQK